MADETLHRLHRLDCEPLLDAALTFPGSTQGNYDRLYPYSFLNRIFLRIQCVHEPVAIYVHWKALGWHVVEGSKAKEIIRPILIHLENEAGEAGEPEERVVGFKPVRCIFALCETAGADPPRI
jgi:hypothetical protein